MIKLFRKIRRCWFIILSMFDNDFIAEVLSIHHPSEFEEYKVFHRLLMENEKLYKCERDELSNWHHLGWKYCCCNPSEMDDLINDLLEKLNKAKNMSVPHNIDKWFKMNKFLQK